MCGNPRRFFLIPSDRTPPVIELTEIGYLMLIEASMIREGSIMMIVETDDTRRLPSALTWNSDTTKANPDGGTTETWEAT